MTTQPFPPSLSALFPNQETKQRRLSVRLPAGRVIRADGDFPVLWFSDQPATADQFTRLLAGQPQSGLQPLLLDANYPDQDDYVPWGCGELSPQRMTSPGHYVPAALLANWWQDYTEADENDPASERDEVSEETAPFGRRWPGLAAPATPRAEPDALASEYAEVLLDRHPHLRLGLVAAPSAAHALTTTGWEGPTNYDNDTAKYSAVLGDWEQRFGARVVCVGSADLRLSVAAPPPDLGSALLLAAEHFACCPDNIWQGAKGARTLTAYAEGLIDCLEWAFWWD